jgi:hypothetical protein
VARLLAILAAVGMIAGAFVFRYGVPGGDGDTGDGAGSGAGGLVCAQELGPVCDALPGAKIEAAAETFERLVGARSASEAGVADWIAPGPWAEMVDAQRGAARPAIFEEPEVVGSSPLVLVTRKSQPIAACGGTATWRCLGDAAQDPAFRLGADGGSTPAGLFVRAAALSGFLETTDYAINDLDGQPEAETWFANLDATLDRAPSFGARSLTDFVAKQGSAQGYLTTRRDAVASTSPDTFDVVAPTPTAAVHVFRARATGGRDLVNERDLTEALRGAGWNVQPDPEDDGLPSAGVLVALRGRVK